MVDSFSDYQFPDNTHMFLVGYGFVAGSEKPVLIRSVAEGNVFQCLKALISTDISMKHVDATI